MEYTTNYHLPQWVETDRIMMGDFNDAMSGIDEGIAEAKEAADSAQQEAEEKGFVIGSYTGNDVTMENGGQVISLGFRPRFLIISRGWTNPNYMPDDLIIMGDWVVNDLSQVITLEDNGFRVGQYKIFSYELNNSNYTYSYIAFR